MYTISVHISTRDVHIVHLMYAYYTWNAHRSLSVHIYIYLVHHVYTQYTKCTHSIPSVHIVHMVYTLYITSTIDGDCHPVVTFPGDYSQVSANQYTWCTHSSWPEHTCILCVHHVYYPHVYTLCVHCMYTVCAEWRRIQPNSVNFAACCQIVFINKSLKYGFSSRCGPSFISCCLNQFLDKTISRYSCSSTRCI